MVAKSLSFKTDLLALLKKPLRFNSGLGIRSFAFFALVDLLKRAGRARSCRSLLKQQKSKEGKSEEQKCEEQKSDLLFLRVIHSF